MDEGYSLAGQRKNCERFVEAKDWRLFRVFEDAGVSGGKRSRPELDALIQAIEAGQVDVLVSPWIDCIGRSAVNSQELFAVFDAAGIALWTPDGTKHDGSTPPAKMPRSVLAASAQYERDMIKVRTQEGAVGKKERGAFNGA